MQTVNVPINWFDLLVAVILLAGLVRGKKRGMSEELLDVFQWLVIVVVSALFYQPLGEVLAMYTGMSLFWGYLISYIFFVVLLKLIFGWIKRLTGEKLVTSDIFGRLEYMLGMLAGGVRYGCILLVSLAILNAKYVSPEHMAAEARMQRENFGTIRFPTIGSLQQMIFVESVSGTFVRNYLDEQLIKPTQYTGINRGKGIAAKRERLVNEALYGQPNRDQ